MRLRLVWLPAAALLGFGCAGPLFDHVKVDPATVEALRRDVPAYTENDLRGRSYAVLEPLRATSCQSKVHDLSPTPENATDQLRAMAARLGGNGLLGVTCEPLTNARFITICWSTLTCHGAAVKVDR
jgi:uncharacterized protein YbjQ (UPF0145 family)